MEPRGIEIREAHYPGRAPIDAFGNGGFRFADMSHRGSLMCLPSGIYGWQPADPANITADDLAKLFEEAGDVQILQVGGRDPNKPSRRGNGFAQQHLVVSLVENELHGAVGGIKRANRLDKVANRVSLLQFDGTMRRLLTSTPPSSSFALLLAGGLLLLGLSAH